MYGFGVLLPDLVLLADEGDELPGRLRPRFWPRTAFCCCAIIRDDVMVIEMLRLAANLYLRFGYMYVLLVSFYSVCGNLSFSWLMVYL